MLFFLRKLARIQTDSVAEKLKELYPDVLLEIGKPVAHRVWKTYSAPVYLFKL